MIEITSSLSISLFLPLSLPAHVENQVRGTCTATFIAVAVVVFVKSRDKTGERACFRIALTTVLREPGQMDRFTWCFVAPSPILK